eukprot:CAMPEP_0115020288 /NCGR_PEP_ID=MMETSP0216-20121206/30002_1 /TAXON_ID=223996 /ORGANISM="Protocruzia adherens, Strain Boccale" /LENGTH=60 /DNA_ID=CAMNT_0002392025 /DNA_START=1246 /DNA_END=1428 /DNA_ORIENTATION=+
MSLPFSYVEKVDEKSLFGRIEKFDLEILKERGLSWWSDLSGVFGRIEKFDLEILKERGLC